MLGIDRRILPTVFFVVLVTGLVGHLPRAAADKPAVDPNKANTPDDGLAQKTGDDLYGLVAPGREVMLAAPLDGVLMRIQVDPGQRVRKDQPLAIMDLRVAVASVDVAQLQADDDESLEYAQLSYQHARLQLRRVHEAHKGEAATDWELHEAALARDQAKAAYDMAIRRNAIAGAVLDLEQEKLERHTIRAPFDGQVIRVFNQPGASLNMADPILMLVALQTLEAQIHLPLSLFGKLRVGEVYVLDAQEPVDKPIDGRLKMIDPVIDPASRTFRCVFDISNQDEALPAGFTVQLKLDALSGQPVTASSRGTAHFLEGPVSSGPTGLSGQ